MKLPRNLTTWIVIGMLAGVGVGHVLHQHAADAAAAKDIAAQFSIITDIFLRLI